MYVCPECGSSSAGPGPCNSDGLQRVASTDPLLGQMVGSYRVARLIGAGGMGQVYKGVQPTIGSRVAIKLLSAECARVPGLIERFFAEARAVNVIRHESIVNVLDLAALPDGRPYIVMEYLDGEPLSALISRIGALPLGSVTRLMTEVLGALVAAHQKGIIHRDLKPDNIFVTSGGRAKVLDFGIAKLKPGIAEVQSATRTGSLLGTPHYMAPEQAAGREVDARSDLYSAGVILFEAATGKRVFDADTLYELLRLHIEQPAPSPRSIRADMPAAYEICVLRALEKDPARRYQTAAEFAAALGQAARFLPEDSWAPLPVSRGPRGTSPMRSVAASSAAPSYTPGPAFQVGPTPGHMGMQPTVGAPHAGLPSGAPTPAVPYAPAPQGAATPYSASYSPSVAGYANTFGGAPAPAASSGRSLMPYFLIGTFALVAVAGMGTCVVLAKLGTVDEVASRNHDTHRSAGVTAPALGGSPQDPATSVGNNDNDITADDPNRVGPDARYSLKIPDTKHFDLFAFLPQAEKMAHRHFKDSVLVRIDADGMRPDGKVDLAFGDSYVLYRFRSPSASKRPAGIPDNVKYQGKCVAYVFARASGAQSYVPGGMDCDMPLIGKPHCSPAQVWRRAASGGAPTGNVIGTLGYWAGPGGHPRWLVSIPPKYSQWIPDACAR